MMSNNMTWQDYLKNEFQHKRLLESASVLKKFCEINNIPRPRIAFYQSRCGECGYYKNGIICIDPSACAREVKNPAMRSWSHPHYFTDRTVYGVLHHEFGHYVHEKLRFPKLPTYRKITSYEPNSHERFAETMKLFLGNPELLREYARERYDKLISLGLKPVHSIPWKDVMQNDEMSERFIKRAQEKIMQS